LPLNIDEKSYHASSTEDVAKHVSKAVLQSLPSKFIALHFTNLNGFIQIEFLYLIKLIVDLIGSENVTVCQVGRGNMVDVTPSRIRGFAISACEMPQTLPPIAVTGISDEYLATQSDKRVMSESTGSTWKGDSKKIKHCIESGCKALAAAESEITDYDQAAGDGDCGYTMRDGSQGL